MTKIFISYRRDDSQYVTDSVFEHMARHFGKENVFLDVGNIPFGVDFRTYLNEQVSAHDVVLVIIGPDWGNIMEERANQQNDFVRIEIESALKGGKLVIPVLVKNAEMPKFTNLPESIHELQWRNSATIRRYPDLENDCKRLADGIQQYIASKGISAPQAEEPQPTKMEIRKEKLRLITPIEGTKQASIDIMPKPFEWIEIPNKGYSIAKYPITNAQFNEFIKAGGYFNEDCWTADGWLEKTNEDWFEPRFWRDEKFNSNNQPVVGVSWFEAVAFCVWLSKVSGENIMLPTEDQWQYAAQGDDDRIYPWGNEWDHNRCNNSVEPCKNEKPTPVKTYEGKGDSPFGVSDMVGNVWELSKTASTSTTNVSIYEIFGGSYLNTHKIQFKCMSTFRTYIHFRERDNGFRIVRND